MGDQPAGRLPERGTLRGTIVNSGTKRPDGFEIPPEVVVGPDTLEW